MATGSRLNLFVGRYIVLLQYGVTSSIEVLNEQTLHLCASAYRRGVAPGRGTGGVVHRASAKAITLINAAEIHAP